MRATRGRASGLDWPRPLFRRRAGCIPCRACAFALWAASCMSVGSCPPTHSGSEARVSGRFPLDDVYPAPCFGSPALTRATTLRGPHESGYDDANEDSEISRLLEIWSRSSVSDKVSAPFPLLLNCQISPLSSICACHLQPFELSQGWAVSRADAERGVRRNSGRHLLRVRWHVA